MVNELWWIYLDGELLHHGELVVPNGDLFMVRFSLSDKSANGESLVGLDNVVITPEPATALLVLVGLGFLVVARRR